MSELKNPVIVEFPLRGEWMAPNTPGTKVPSHGTNQLGQRYAFDFLQIDQEKKGMHFYKTSKLRYFFLGVPLSQCLCWGKEVYAPCDGKVFNCEDGFKERRRVHLLSDMAAAIKNSLTFDPKKGLQTIAGNYIIMECENNVYAFFAHFKKGSIKVSVGEDVTKGQLLGSVGHSGNSTAPHLHFHLMDNSDLLKANGIPCAFEKYEVWEENAWETVTNGIPNNKELIRFKK
ncbi:peptidase M23-like protein [Natranaerovirga hydrolytica]|uniref:Peptidase M23-like protein n=1 Tax=Natranaerovirga hydrolytica TaxID=680378 RepID=A0A4R1MAR4_9FIRM|nr:M23 family metallopeptidase [Natranaerovirga hydrolytica]TCK88044.1 peptidase M23-like protein [Natranaerovirga hydrolytica]